MASQAIGLLLTLINSAVKPVCNELLRALGDLITLQNRRVRRGEYLTLKFMCEIASFVRGIIGRRESI
jgi:hypothetical protein